MALKLSDYIGIHVGCGIGIFTIIGLILLFSTKYAHNLYTFLLKRILSVRLEYPNDNTTDVYIWINIDGVSVRSRYRSRRGKLLWFIATCTLTLSLMVLFEGCILGSVGLSYGDDCPSDPMTCFTQYSDGIEKQVFQCVPGNKTILFDEKEKAWCYGWIANRQSVSSVMNQIGICAGILGVNRTLFALMFRSARGHTWQKVIWIILSILSTLAVPSMIIVASVSRMTFSILAYLVAAEVAILFTTVAVFKPGENDNTTIF